MVHPRVHEIVTRVSEQIGVNRTVNTSGYRMDSYSAVARAAKARPEDFFFILVFDIF